MGVPGRESVSAGLRTIDAAGLAVCLLLTAGLFFAGLRPMLHRQAAVRALESELAERHREADASAEALAVAGRRLAEAERAVAANPIRLQGIERLNAWLATMAEAASASGVELHQLEPGSPAAAAHYVTVPIRVVGEGTFGDTTRFLHRLHEAMPDIAVPALHLKSHPRSGRVGGTFEFDLVWHAAPVAAGLASVEER